MKVKYIYSACLEINCSGFKILTDPWFTNGIYDGSWFKFPEIDPFDYIEKPDLIYISHIHPDHYDPIFLKKLMEKFGEIPIFIPDLKKNYLLFKGKFDGFNLQPKRYFKNSKVELFIEEQLTGSFSDIDSAILVKDLKTNHVILNTNDCIINEKHFKKLKKIINSITDKLDVLALGYTGAGAYPQTYFNQEDELKILKKEADIKKNEFFRRYKVFTDNFPAIKIQ